METALQELEKEELVDRLTEANARIPELEKKVARLEKLELELQQLRRHIFGAKKERFVPAENPNQLKLDFGDIGKAEDPPKEEIIAEHTRKKPKRKSIHKGRNPLPDHLPRETTIIEPKEDTSGMKQIGQEVSEVLEMIPAKLFVIQKVRPVYADGDRVVVAPMPGRAINKGLFGPGLLTQIIVDKYLDHQPLYRQSKRFAREEVHVAESTMADAIKNVSNLIEPLWEAHRRETLTQPYLQIDETPIKVLDRKKDKNITRGYHWAYYSPLTKTVLFDYRPSRGRAGPEDLLQNYQGFIQTDGYAVYDQFDKKKGIVQLNCMAHARRKFEQAKENHPELAEYALTQIQYLYQVERKAREEELSHEQRQEIREKYARPVWVDFYDWLIYHWKDVTPKSAIGKAIEYTLPRWKKLAIYLLDGRLEIDNNLIENSIRPIALGRKNYLFSGSHEGARRAAILYSLLGTCKLHNINPQEWLKEIITKISDHPINRVHELLPQHWKRS